MNALQSYSSDEESANVSNNKLGSKSDTGGTNYDDVGMDISEDSGAEEDDDHVAGKQRNSADNGAVKDKDEDSELDDDDDDDDGRGSDRSSLQERLIGMAKPGGEDPASQSNTTTNRSGQSSGRSSGNGSRVDQLSERRSDGRRGSSGSSPSRDSRRSSSDYSNSRDSRRSHRSRSREREQDRRGGSSSSSSSKWRRSPTSPKRGGDRKDSDRSYHHHRRDERGGSSRGSRDDRRPRHSGRPNDSSERSRRSRSRSKSRERRSRSRERHRRSRSRSRERDRDRYSNSRKAELLHRKADTAAKLAAMAAVNPGVPLEEMVRRNLEAQAAAVQKAGGAAAIAGLAGAAPAGSTLPPSLFANPLASTVSTRLAEQERKRRLLWGGAAKPAATPAIPAAAPMPSASAVPGAGSTSLWQNTTFVNDQDGKMAEKFKRLMGVKGGAPGAALGAATPIYGGGRGGGSSSSAGSGGARVIGGGGGGPSTIRSTRSPEGGEEQLKRQEDLFSSMERQYEMARLATHTQKGFGLGFGSSSSYLPK